ncbi:PREDICTED: protein RRNAD1, partial [Calidris pugnax]|uniref:protein RRNAD1 n=1 Tax=Calidris pugnax TaxID=198806 RepID=UPI00071D08F7
LGGSGGAQGGQRVLVTGLHACGDLSPALLRHFARSPSVAAVASVACCYMKLSTPPQPPGCPPGYPLSSWVTGLPGHELSYRAREAACHALEEYRGRLDGENQALRVHCYRAVLETLIRAADPTKKHPGVQTVKKAHALSFPQEVVESPEHHNISGFHCALVPLFNPRFSPRNLVLVAARTPLGTVLEGLEEESSEDEDTGGAEPPQEGQRPPVPSTGRQPQ